MVLLYECLLLRSDQSFQCSGFSLRSIFLKSGNSNGRQKPSAFTYNEGTVLWFGLSVKPDCIEEKLSNANGVNAFSETHLMEPCYLLLLEVLRIISSRLTPWFIWGELIWFAFSDSCLRARLIISITETCIGKVLYFTSLFFFLLHWSTLDCLKIVNDSNNCTIHLGQNTW